MKVLQEAGLPNGVINLVYAGGKETAEVVFNTENLLTTLHWLNRCFQRHVGYHCQEHFQLQILSTNCGETGGKDYIFAILQPIRNRWRHHHTWCFRISGSEVPAASRAYIPENIWETVKTCERRSFKDKNRCGGRFQQLCHVVIDEESFDKLAKVIDEAKPHPMQRLFVEAP